jgi:CheY-like chemotaxis protein
MPTDTREVHDGVEVVRYLEGEGEYSDRGKYPFPDLLLVDLKMPRMDGLGVLEWVRTQPECAFLPAIMMSSSDHEADIVEAHRRGVKAYFVKPSDLRELEK